MLRDHVFGVQSRFTRCLLRRVSMIYLSGMEIHTTTRGALTVLALTTIATLAACDGAPRTSVSAACPGEASAAGATASGNWEVVDAFPRLSLVDPISLSFEPGSNRFLVASAAGRIEAYDRSGDPASRQLVLDISDRVKRNPEDGGLKSFTFHPQYGHKDSPNRNYIYVHYRYGPEPKTTGPEAYNRVSRFSIAPGDPNATAASELVLIQQYDRHHWHDGGDMAFGPDGFLYISTGDEGLENDHYSSMGRLDQELFGGILRIDVDNDPQRSHPRRRIPLTQAVPPPGWPPSKTGHYSIPNDNPWLDPQGKVLEEFWAYGLRSPHRMTIDPATGEVWTGDVGSSRFEEIDRVVAGGNYQWPFMEGVEPGPKPRPEMVVGTEQQPVWYYGRKEGQAVIGGYVYRGERLRRQLCGHYLFADHLSGNIWAMPGSGYGTGIAAFALGDDHEIYMLKWNGYNRDGARIYRLEYSPGKQ